MNHRLIATGVFGLTLGVVGLASPQTCPVAHPQTLSCGPAQNGCTSSVTTYFLLWLRHFGHVRRPWVRCDNVLWSDRGLPHASMQQHLHGV